ncbi:MAG: cardiolipin synthase [Candidatus Moraniibacteriota bacterium]|nr:MAG: cardiolipin synthase [Candidatus Moranbacteria bacterium]
MHALLSLVEGISGLAVFGIYLYLAVVVVFIIMENRDISSTLAWILVFLLFPIIGFVLYVFFGRNWKVVSPNKKEHIKDLQEKVEHVLFDLRARQKKYLKNLDKDHVSYGKKRIIRVTEKNIDSLITFQNDVKIIQSGKEKFDLLKRDIKNAKNFIHLEYFIWRKDVLTEEIKTLLIKKAKEGVEIRVLFDPVGTFFTYVFSPRYFASMKKAGIEVVPFYNKLSPFKITTVNYLLHRKIVIIDGKIGYTGGMNMGQEYVDGGNEFDSWRDTHLRVCGESVLSLQTTFAVNWEEASGKSIFDKIYFPTYSNNNCNNLMVQMIVSDPHAYWQTIHQSLFAMALAARKHVYVQTPYFIPDVNLFEALKIIALSGIDVKIMVAGIPDKYIVYWAAFTYFEELLNAGVEIYHYNAGFMHAKTFSVDGKVCSIGTTNMDIRSLHLSYENNVLIYDDGTTQKLENDFLEDIKKCKRFTLEDYKKINVFAKLRNSLVRLLSPLL